MNNYEGKKPDYQRPFKKGKTVYSYYILDRLDAGDFLFMKNSWHLAGPGGKSIIGILTDEAITPKPLISFSERVAIAQSLRYADIVVPQKTKSPIENIQEIKPDILILSSEGSRQDVENAREEIRKWGGKIMILPHISKTKEGK